jgi:hypothetical protein
LDKIGQSSEPEAPANRYRNRADELRAMARAAQSDGVQRELLLVAQQYENLAEDVGRIDRWRQP